MKKVVSIILVLILTLSLTGCGQMSPADNDQKDSSNVSASSAPEATQAGKSEGFYGGIDTSKHVDIYMYMIGSTELADLDKVLVKINEKLEAEVNATLHVEIIAIGEYATKYPLILSSGEDCDLIFTAGWLNFEENVKKNAFIELTEDFRNKYMPQSVTNEAPEAWEEIAINGKVYAVPRNQADFDSVYALAIRKDLREKYGLAPIQTFEDYEKYLHTIAEKEKDIYGLYSMNSWAAQYLYFYLAKNKITTTSDGDNFVWRYDSDNTVDPSEIEFWYETPEYKEYVMKMAEWAAKGVWPSNTIASSVFPTDQFNQGRSASCLASATSLQRLIETTIKNGVVASEEDIEIVDLFSGTPAIRSPYSGDCVAIPTSSKNPERAAMVLDMLKNDHELNMLIIGGFEGEHYILDTTDNTRSAGPSIDNYPWDSFTWSIRNDWNPKLKMFDQVQAIRDAFGARERGDWWPLNGFKFDQSSVNTQYSVIHSLTQEYMFSFDLGVFGDQTEAKLAEYIQQLKDAGLEELKAAYMQQITDYLAQK